MKRYSNPGLKFGCKPKWFSSDRDVKVGDVILFLKQSSVLCSTYQLGIIEYGKDKKIRKVNVKYQNHNENVDRFY